MPDHAMENKIYEGYGLEIMDRDGRYFLSYDGGGIVVEYKEIEISKDDVCKIQENGENAYGIIIKTIQAKQ